MDTNEEACKGTPLELYCPKCKQQQRVRASMINLTYLYMDVLIYPDGRPPMLDWDDVDAEGDFEYVCEECGHVLAHDMDSLEKTALREARKSAKAAMTDAVQDMTKIPCIEAPNPIAEARLRDTNVSHLTMATLYSAYPGLDFYVAKAPETAMARNVYNALVFETHPATAEAVSSAVYMLAFTPGSVADRPLVLLAASFVEPLRDMLYDYRSKRVLDIALAYGQGKATVAELNGTLPGAKNAGFASFMGNASSMYAAHAAYMAGCTHRKRTAVIQASRFAIAAVKATGKTEEAVSHQITLLRNLGHVFGE